MGRKCGPYAVHVVNPDTGEAKWFHPGDDFGSWAKHVDNPHAFAGTDEAKADEAEGEAPESAEEREARLAEEADEADRPRGGRGRKTS